MCAHQAQFENTPFAEGGNGRGDPQNNCKTYYDVLGIEQASGNLFCDNLKLHFDTVKLQGFPNVFLFHLLATPSASRIVLWASLCTVLSTKGVPRSTTLVPHP